MSEFVEARFSRFNRNWRHRITVVGAFLIPVAIAAFFRLWRIHDVPPGLSDDEASFATLAVSILNGNFYQVNEIGTFLSYTIVPFIARLGRVPLATRLPGALSGIAATAMLYLFVQQVYGRRLLSTVAATIFAVTVAAFHINRLAFPATHVPLLQSAIYYFFWRGWQRKSRMNFAVSGLLTGLILHTYQSALAIPLAMAIVLGWWAWTHRRAAVPYLLAFGTGFLLFAIPYGISVISSLVYFRSARYSSVFIFNPDVHNGALFNVLLHQLWIHLGMYGVVGDTVWRHNLPNRPLFDPLLSVFFWAGVLLTARDWRRPLSKFLLLQYVVLLLPAFLAFSANGPVWTHVTPVFILSAIFAARSMEALVQWGYQQYRHSFLKYTAAIALVIFLTVEGVMAYRDYFGLWATQVGPTMSFDELFVQTASMLNENEGRVDTWIIPKAASEPVAGHPYSLEFLYTSSTPLFFVPAEDRVASQLLEEDLAEKTRVGLVEWTPTALKWAAPVYADARRQVHFLLQKNASKFAYTEQDGMQISLFELEPDTHFSSPLSSSRDETWTFGDIIQLTGSETGVVNTSGEYNAGDVWVRLRWSVTDSLPDDYKASIRILDGQGNQIAQVDELLFDEASHPTSSWQPKSEVWNNSFLTLPPGTPPDVYTIVVAVYKDGSQFNLPISAGDRWSARQAQVTDLRLQRIIRARDAIPSTPLSQPQGASVTLLGYNLFPQTVRTGDTLRIPLFWRAITEWTTQGNLRFRLDDGQTGTSVFQTSLPFATFASKSGWRAGDTFARPYSLPLPRELPAGSYWLRVTVEAPGSTMIEPWWDLGEVHVEGWPRQFVLPQIQEQTDIAFGDSIELVGYDNPKLSSESAVALKLCWQALREMDVSFVAFVQVLNSDGQLVAQADAVPGHGGQPTTGWLSGEFICDDFELAAKEPLPPGEYEIITGFYDPRFERRLLWTSPDGHTDDKYTVATFSVEP